MLYEIPLRTAKAAGLQFMPVTDPATGVVRTVQQPVDVVYASLIKEIIETPRQAGVTLDAMRKSLAILTELQKATDSGLASLRLDNELYRFLKDLVSAQIWSVPSRGSLDFVDAVLGAQTVEANALAVSKAKKGAA